jgi:hypothetical protein
MIICPISEQAIQMPDQSFANSMKGNSEMHPFYLFGSDPSKVAFLV